MDIMHAANRMDDFFDYTGYVPVVSSATGPLRVIWGIFEAVIVLPLFMIAPKRFEENLYAAGTNIVRGIVETVPLIGNIAMRVFDTKRDKEPIRRTEFVVYTFHGMDEIETFKPGRKPIW